MTTLVGSLSGEAKPQACHSVYREFITPNRVGSGGKQNPSMNNRPVWQAETVLSDVVIPVRTMPPLPLLADFHGDSQNTGALAGTAGCP
jgi:hypothetical protein